MKSDKPDQLVSTYERPRSAPRLAYFHEVYDFCRGYPYDIRENLDALHRMVWPEPKTRVEQSLQLVRFARQLDIKRVVEALWSRYEFVLRSSKRMPKVIPRKSNSVLITFEPCRNDYKEFVCPVAEMLTQRGVPTSVLVSRTMFEKEISPVVSSRYPTFFEEDYRFLDDRLWAKACYERLEPLIERLCLDLELTPSQCYATRTLFQEYFRDKALFCRVLDNLQPKLIYGIHYLLKPGFRAAIREYKKKNTSARSILIQHGLLPSARGSHDFRGADYVILWGRYFENALRKLDESPSLTRKVIGNPRVEKMAEAAESRSGQHKAWGVGTILFVSQPNDGGEYQSFALELFARAVSSMPEWEIIYKLHPAQQVRDFRPLISRGLIRLEQIRSGSIYELMKEADVVVGTQSTALPEAIALKIPVLQLLPKLSDTDWEKYGIATASTERELQVQLSLMKYLDERQRLLRRELRLAREMFNTLQGSSARIAEYLRKML